MAFVTGSRAYGTPGPDSDFDLAVLLDHDDCGDLCDFFSDSIVTGSRNGGVSIRFGKLNLLVFVVREKFDAWRAAMLDLKGRRPVTRIEAIKTIEAYEKNAQMTDLRLLIEDSKT